MKNLLPIFLLLILFSCNTNKKSDNQKDSTADTAKKEIVKPALDKTKSLVGEWTITSTISQGVEGKCNACPKINFKSDGAIIITKPKGETENLKWEMNGDKIKIMTTDNTNPDGLFADMEYTMTFTQHKDSDTLNLVQMEKNYSYVLNR